MCCRRRRRSSPRPARSKATTRRLPSPASSSSDFPAKTPYAMVLAEQKYLAGAKGVRAATLRRLSPNGWVIGVATDRAHRAGRTDCEEGAVIRHDRRGQDRRRDRRGRRCRGRCEARRPRAGSRLARGCGGRQQTSSGVTADDAIFYVKSNVADANLFVDGRFVGPVASSAAASRSYPVTTASSFATRTTSRATSSSISSAPTAASSTRSRARLP